MHKGASHSSDSEQSVSQAEADSCCAATEGDRSSPSSEVFGATFSLAVLGSPAPALTPIDLSARSSGSATSPATPSHVPKHVLLSVFIL